ncbi:MAG: GNAT family N-acetyltransferase [Sedimentisphaerales bacterium]|nr:GNAT family N-acetyltransferase [Sedimentisphaerales bacterium]
MTIRPAGIEDLDTVVSLLQQACATVAQRFGLTMENCPKSPAFYTHDRARDDLARGVRYFLLEENGTACACVALEQAKPDLVYLERLAVLPEQRRRGYGQALVRHALAQANTLGVRRVEIGIISEDAELQDWYGRFGFVQTGTKRFDHLPFGVAFMAKQLGNDIES